MKVHLKRQSCSKQVFHSNGAIFREYVDTTTTNGVNKIFRKEYSIVRRLFWLAAFVTAAALCLVNCTERIKFYISSPTSTASSSVKVKPAYFPAVTVCNLNRITMSGLAHEGLLESAMKISSIGNQEPDYLSRCEAVISDHPRAQQVLIHDLLQNAAQSLDDFIQGCKFLGQSCQDGDFVHTVYSYGMCYTFNGHSRVPSLQTNGTGSHHGLYLTVNINQNEYIGSDLTDAGVKIFVHPASEPARVLDQGIAVAPGTALYVGMQQQIIVNEAGVDCTENRDSSHFNFLGNTLNYSVHGCLQDCVLTEIAKTCKCYYIGSEIPSNPAYVDIRNCTFADICCIEKVSVTSLDCDCPTACESTKYDLTTSYSRFPADIYTPENSVSSLEPDALEVSVYFHTLVVSKETTSFSYSFIGLLSDIGGLLGLYLGIGIFALMEFVIWIVDEALDRLCCFLITFRKKKKKSEEDQPLEMEYKDDIEMEETTVPEEIST